jgi:MoxR-like ATPase
MTGTRSEALAALQQELAGAGYIAEPQLAAALMLMQDLQRPLLLEGDAGVGKTEVAKVLASLRGTRLIRLQCYEGLDAHSAMYEWNYQRQLLAIKLLEQDERASSKDLAQKEQDIFSERYLLKRPLLEAISDERPPVLLIDEIDRADEAFEAFLLEMLSEYQVTVPELGTLHARSKPLVVLTSNGTRDLSDALRRRCLFHYLDFPTLARETQIVRSLVPEAAGRLVEEAVAFVQRLRKQDLEKTPGVAETLDWVRVLFKLGHVGLPVDPQLLVPSLAALLKTRTDRWLVTSDTVAKLLDGPRIAQDVGVAGAMK